MKKACFVCSTPFHIIVASAITMSEGLYSDIIVVKNFSGCEIICENLKKTGVFHEISIIDDPFNRDSNTFSDIVKVYISVLCNYLKVESVIGKYFKNPVYDSVYVYHREPNIVRMICMFLRKHNLSIKMYYYEDGIGSYYNNVIFNDYRLTQLFEYVYCGKKISLNDFSIKLFCPELYTFGFNNDKPIQNCEPIKKINKIDGFDKVLSGIFSKNDNNKILENIIFLDTVREEEFNEEGKEVFNEISILLSEKYRNNMIIKYHPRDIKCSSKEKDFSNDGIPFEYYCNYNDLNNKLIISSFSTAAFTPKILYGQEPYVVFLFNIIGKGMIDNTEIDKLYKYLMKIYNNKKKICAPNTIEELIDITNSFMESFVKNN